MPKKLLAILLIAVSLFSLTISAGVPASASGFGINSTVAANPGPNRISVDESSNGTNIGLSVGNSLTVNLKYTGGAPVFWNLGPFNTSVLQMVDNYFIPPANPHPGATGTEVWVFKAIGLGTSPVLLEYRSVSGQVVKTFNVTVNVLPSVPASSNLTIGILAAGLTFLMAWLTLKKTRQSHT